jgi:hypothetical protein
VKLVSNARSEGGGLGNVCGHHATYNRRNVAIKTADRPMSLVATRLDDLPLPFRADRSRTFAYAPEGLGVPSLLARPASQESIQKSGRIAGFSTGLYVRSHASRHGALRALTRDSACAYSYSF